MKTIEMFNPVTIASEQDYDPVSGKHSLEILVTYENFHIYRPQIHENNGATKLMFPQEARLRNFTYSSAMTIDMSIKYIVRTGEHLENVQTFYKYDGVGRLLNVKDHNGNITDQYNYAYSTTAPTGCTTPDAPSISISSSNLCNATLTASGCSGTSNWSNGGAGGNITVSTKTTTTYTATCTVSGCSSSASNALVVPVLPSGWSSADIGSADGCTQNNSGALTLQGSGNVGGSDDSFHWIYKSMSGDFTMIVKINNLPVVNGQRSGIMIRSNTNTNAQFYTLIQDGNENVGELKRDTNGGTGGLYSFAGSAANQTWIKVVKTGTSIKGYHSTDSNPEANNAWNDYFNLTGNSPTTLDFGANYLIGLVTYGTANQTTFTNITLNGNAF
jgi:hypothetical protein